MSDAIRRALRTLFQWVVSGGITLIIDQLADGLSPTQTALVQGGNLLLVTFAQNWLEDNTGFPAIGKSPASDGENPVPEV